MSISEVRPLGKQLDCGEARGIHGNKRHDSTNIHIKAESYDLQSAQHLRKHALGR